MTPLSGRRRSHGQTARWVCGGPLIRGFRIQAAAMHPPHLVVVVVGVTGSDYHNNWTYSNGVFDLWLSQIWVAKWAYIDAFRRCPSDSGFDSHRLRGRSGLGSFVRTG